MMTRAEHLQWCKDRALKYVELGQCQNALTSMMSDLDKHPETASPALNQLTVGLMMIGSLSTPEAVRKHIEGFHRIFVKMDKWYA